jgi:hypothetical protein
MGSNGQQWVAMASNGQQGAARGSNGQQWAAMGRLKVEGLKVIKGFYYKPFHDRNWSRILIS